MKTLPELTLEITRYHEAVRDNPDDTKAQGQLKDKLSQWYNSLSLQTNRKELYRLRERTQIRRTH